MRKEYFISCSLFKFHPVDWLFITLKYICLGSNLTMNERIYGPTVLKNESFSNTLASVWMQDK